MPRLLARPAALCALALLSFSCFVAVDAFGPRPRPRLYAKVRPTGGRSPLIPRRMYTS